MKRIFYNFTLFLIILSLAVIFSSCADNTGVSILGGETTCEEVSIDITPETSEIHNEETTEAETEHETEKETEVQAIQTTAENDVITEQIESEAIPEDTTTAPETENETEPETTEKVESKSGTEYLLNTNSKKFHHMSCKSGQKTKDVNRAYHTGTREEVIAKGYVPCKVCNP